jgi:hypothetical protein
MKIGPSHSSQGLTEGIHWHINKNVKIDYIAKSSDRLEIPWVRYINLATGDTTIYQDSNNSLNSDEIAERKHELREMDCMDCHNRPSHNYETPQDFIDHAIAGGIIPVELPNVKSIAMKVLYATYNTEDSALLAIEEELNKYYSKKYPEFYNGEDSLVNKAIEGIQNEFKKNIFPEMKASWDVYPDHIGHVEYNGCFRCHSGFHESEQGSTISNDCNLCHTILLQGTPDSLEVAQFNNHLEFKHPEDIDDAWKEMLCSECHRYLY